MGLIATYGKYNILYLYSRDSLLLGETNLGSSTYSRALSLDVKFRLYRLPLVSGALHYAVLEAIAFMSKPNRTRSLLLPESQGFYRDSRVPGLLTWRLNMS